MTNRCDRKFVTKITDTNIIDILKDEHYIDINNYSHNNSIKILPKDIHLIDENNIYLILHI